MDVCLKNILDEIYKNSSFVITGHMMPDGDSVGSSVALYHFLIKLGKKVKIVFEDKIPEQFSFLTQNITMNDISAVENADILIVLDCGDCDRISINKKLVNSSNVINIDHHISNTNFGYLNYVEATKASVGEIIYDIIRLADIDIDTDMAEGLFVSISTDTGHFQYSNTDSNTFLIMSELLKTKIQITKLYEQLYCHTSKEKLALIAAVYGNIEYYYNYKIAMGIADIKTIEECLAKVSDTDSIISTIRDIDGVEVAIFIKEIECQYYKIGLRSKNTVNVASIASAFGGGGHIRAAGFSMRGNLEEVKKNTLDAIIHAWTEV